MLNLFLLAVGCLMDIFSAIIVVAPLIVPVALAFGVDPVHLGVILLANLELGYLTPPVGLNLFMSASRFGRPVLEVARATLPMLVGAGDRRCADHGISAADAGAAAVGAVAGSLRVTRPQLRLVQAGAPMHRGPQHRERLFDDGVLAVVGQDREHRRSGRRPATRPGSCI